MVDYELNSYKETWIIDSIYNAVGKISHKITNVEIVERRIVSRVGKYLSLNEANRTHRRYIIKLIQQEVSAAIRRCKREYATHIEELTTSNEEGQDIIYEPVDVLANVESDVIVKETITLLAKDDRRKEMILNAWADGCNDDTEISNFLAEVLTGQATGHLSYIKRFRKTCKAELSAQYVC